MSDNSSAAPSGSNDPKKSSRLTELRLKTSEPLELTPLTLDEFSAGFESGAASSRTIAPAQDPAPTASTGFGDFGAEIERQASRATAYAKTAATIANKTPSTAFGTKNARIAATPTTAGTNAPNPFRSAPRPDGSNPFKPAPGAANPFKTSTRTATPTLTTRVSSAATPTTTAATKFPQKTTPKPQTPQAKAPRTQTPAPKPQNAGQSRPQTQSPPATTPRANAQTRPAPRFDTQTGKPLYTNEPFVIKAKKPLTDAELKTIVRNIPTRSKPGRPLTEAELKMFDPDADRKKKGPRIGVMVGILIVLFCIMRYGVPVGIFSFFVILCINSTLGSLFGGKSNNDANTTTNNEKGNPRNGSGRP